MDAQHATDNEAGGGRIVRFPVPGMAEEAQTPDPTIAILRECGALAVAIWHVAANLSGAGEPVTYFRLEEEMDLSERSVIKHVKALERAGFVRLERRRSGQGKDLPTLIFPTPSWVHRGMNGGMNQGVNDETPLNDGAPMRDERMGAPRDERRDESSPFNPLGKVNDLSLETKREILTPQSPPADPEPPRRKHDPYLDPFDEGFAEWWAIYPRQDNEKRARLVWAQLQPGPELRAEMMTALRDQLPFWATRERANIPMPATWLLDERWRDSGLNLAVPPNGHQRPIDKTRALRRSLEEQGL